ncbi:MAG: hypothetical protein JO266_15535 [Acidobacteria bacterium]|nr:hypothetical protein [Acidobacteriota bacterium]
MSRVFYISALGLGVLLLGRCLAGAQSEELPLGDLARSLRKNQFPPRAVIDNDNLSTVMEQGENRRWATPERSLPGNNRRVEKVKISSPDVTCALSFSGQKDVLGENREPQKLPEEELGKLDGPASIVAGSLQLAIHNGSSWDVREITVSVTVVQHPSDISPALDGPALTPAAMNDAATAEKHSDRTVLYHVKGSAAPSSTTLFQTPLSLTINGEQERHWAIVQARGLPPAARPTPAAQQIHSPAPQAPK